MSTINIALQDASHALLEAVEKERVRDALHAGTSTLPVQHNHVVDSTLNSNEELHQPPSQQRQKQHQKQSTNNSSASNGKDSEEEDPIMAAFLEAQHRSSVLNFDDWARLIVLLSNNGTVPKDGNVSNVQ